MRKDKTLRKKNLESGSVFRNIIIFAFPYVILNILQNLFQTTDIAVLGIMVGDDSVAAVGAISSLNNLLINFFIGLSVGVQAVLTKHIATKNQKEARKTVGASIFFSLLAGTLIFVCAFPFIEDILRLMSCDPKLIPLATKYLRIYFLSMPVMMLYNISAAILRDNVKLIKCLIIGCLFNFGLDFGFVWLGYGVEGVAVASLISQFVSAILIIFELIKNQSYQGFRLRYFWPNVGPLKQVLSVGMPVALRALIFSASNVIVQASINKFGAFGMSANAAAQQFDGIIYDIGNAIAVATMIVIGQGVVERRMDSVKRAIITGSLLAFFVPLTFGLVFTIFAPQLCGFILDNEEVVKMAVTRLSIMSLTYFLGAQMEVLGYSVQAMGQSKLSLKISLLGELVIRLGFLIVAMKLFPSFAVIFIAYPISWLLTIFVYLLKIPEVYAWLKDELATENHAEELIKEIQEDIEIKIMEN